MSDYECPACGGGFPTTDADDACPWCGESMDGDAGNDSATPQSAPRLPDGRRYVPIDRGDVNPMRPYEPTITNDDTDDGVLSSNILTSNDPRFVSGTLDPSRAVGGGDPR